MHHLTLPGIGRPPVISIPHLRAAFAGQVIAPEDPGYDQARMVARTATDQERAELWPRIISRYQGYARYQRRTERPIPVVILEPEGRYTARPGHPA